MRFTVAGLLKPEHGGDYATFDWEDGRVHALPHVMRLLYQRDDELTGTLVGVIPSDYTTVNHLKNAMSTRCIASDLWEDPDFYGDEPEVVKEARERANEPLPEGVAY